MPGICMTYRRCQLAEESADEVIPLHQDLSEPAIFCPMNGSTFDRCRHHHRLLSPASLSERI